MAIAAPIPHLRRATGREPRLRSRSPSRCSVVVSSHRARDLPRLRAELGRLRPFRIRRPPARVLCVGLRRPARAVVGQPLLCTAAASTSWPRSPPRFCRSPCSRRAGWWARRSAFSGCSSPGGSGRRIGGPLAGLDRARAARHLPALLRPHVHEPEGLAVRGRDGDPAARPRARASRNIRARRPRPSRWSASASACRSARASWARSARSRRSPRWRLILARRGAHRAASGRRRARLGRFVLALAARDAARLCGDGAGLALVGDRSAQSAPGDRVFLALLREAVGGAVRRRA